MRVLIDYRAALRERTGVGEYAHQLACALAAEECTPGHRSGPRLELTLFSSSWKDRVPFDPELKKVAVIDRRVPVSVLNFAWHRLEWPSAEALTRERFDVVHSLHPLLLPARDAAQIVTVHDLNFLLHPERTRAEIRRDYSRLARAHAARADRIIAVSKFTAGEVQRLLGVSADRISICSPGAPPSWSPREPLPQGAGYVLFFGTLEPRKNVGALLDAYEIVAGRRKAALPALILAGKATPQAGPWLERIARPPLSASVRHIGYVDPVKRRALYEGARVLVQPSFEEGFGMPVLEAMTVGVPVIAANRGALPEVAGPAGTFVEPTSPEDLAAALETLLDDDRYTAERVTAGFAQARRYTWEATASATVTAYQLASGARRQRGAA